MWDKRYAQPGYLFGKEPAEFLKSRADMLAPGMKALALADGEGRNSVYLAGLGLNVVAMEASANALEKAQALAEERGVEVDYHTGDILAWDWDAAQYDVVVAVFIQFLTPAERAEVFAGMIRSLKPGGLILLHGYRPEQIAYGTGGPRAVENLYTEALLRDAFAGLEIIALESYDREIDEGEGHSGMSALIDLVAKKPL